MTRPGKASTTTYPATGGIGWFGQRAVLGWGALVFGAGPFLLLWLLMRSWSPLAEFDHDVAQALNGPVSGHPWAVPVLSVVTDLGGSGTAILVMTLATVFLLIRRQRRLAAFLATAGVGLAVLGPATKAIADRARPLVDTPVVQTPSNASFPSGHAMTAVVVWGALLLVALPAVQRRARPWLIAGTIALAVAIGLTRLALGVHFVSDVLAGWALGIGWLASTVAAFRAWQHDLGRAPDEPLDPLDVPPDEAVQLTSSGRPAFPRRRRPAARLLSVAAVLFVGVTALGLLVTTVLTDSWFGRLDRTVVEWLVEQRGPGRTALVETLAMLSGTRMVIAVALTLAVVALAVTARWQPVVFVAVTVLGELVLYLATSQVVGRARPAVADLTAGLPSEASWPSGHATAAAALYGALAALVIVYARSRWRWAVLVVPVLVSLLVGVSRLYVAAHHPSDVLAGLLLGGVWVYACARVLLPAPGRGPRTGVVPVPVETGRQP